MKTIEKVNVENMESNSGKVIPNQFLIRTEEGTYFQSYKTIIALKKWEEDHTQIYLDENSWDYSETTGKYRNIFLNETKKETEAKIKSGEYILCNLN